MSKYVVVMEPGESGFKLTPAVGDRVKITVPMAEFFKVFSSDGSQETVVMAPNSATFPMQISGLVSDWQVIDMDTGSCYIVVESSPAELDLPTNLQTDAVLGVELCSADAMLSLYRNLKGNIMTEVSFTGSLFVSKCLSGADCMVAAETYPGSIAMVVMTVLEEWADLTLEDIADLTLDELMYKEVGT